MATYWVSRRADDGKLVHAGGPFYAEPQAWDSYYRITSAVSQSDALRYSVIDDQGRQCSPPALKRINVN
jgi:hypothetical protein